jgi:major membrane immunogen (membrane-anchored lipoprotein)
MKKLLSVLMILMLSLSLVACGEYDDDDYYDDDDRYEERYDDEDDEDEEWDD